MSNTADYSHPSAVEMKKNPLGMLAQDSVKNVATMPHVLMSKLSDEAATLVGDDGQGRLLVGAESPEFCQ